MNIYYSIATKVPSHVTISNWVKKVGYYQLSLTKEIANDWIIILDESIQLGGEKLLLILGVRSCNIDFSRPLGFTDVLPIILLSKKGWNALKVKEELEKAKKMLGNIKYAVSDKGAAINKGLELCGIPHIHDVSHRIANILKKTYKEDSSFKGFINNLGTFRSQIQQTEWAYFLPPQQRTQSRFMNLKPVMEWGMRIIEYSKKEEYNELSLDMKEKLQWIIAKEKFIKEINKILHVIEEIFKLLKNNGLNQDTEIKCINCLNTLTSQKGQEIKKDILYYFEEVRAINNRAEKVLCTSDIIESSFGLYKNIISRNAFYGITNLSLCISANSVKMDLVDIKHIMEDVNYKMIKNWTKINICESLLKKRREAIGKNRAKIKYKSVA